MKRERKEEKLNKAEMLARKGLIRETVTVFSIVLLAFILLILAVLKKICETSPYTISTFLNEFGEIFVIPFFIFFLSIFGYWYLRKDDHLNYAYEKIRQDFSKQLVEKFLVPLEPTTVIIINTRNKSYKNYILGLNDVSEFYAILNYDNTITIYSKFKDAPQDLFFDIITKEQFTTYCKLQDNPEE